MPALYAEDTGRETGRPAPARRGWGVAIAGRAGHRDGVTRAAFAIVLGFLGAALAFAGCNGGGSSRPAFPRCKDCNVVLVSVDTLRADYVGAYGFPRPVTP